MLEDCPPSEFSSLADSSSDSTSSLDFYYFSIPKAYSFVELTFVILWMGSMANFNIFSHNSYFLTFFISNFPSIMDIINFTLFDKIYNSRSSLLSRYYFRLA